MFRPTLTLMFIALFVLSGFAPVSAMGSNEQKAKIHRVLLISVDGLHAFDLAHFVSTHPDSNLAKLAGEGTTYTQANTPPPADSFPGMVALVTGGTPASTGIWYDDTINRSYLAPGSTRANPGEPGAEVAWDESIDVGFNKGQWGVAGVDPNAFSGAKSIDPAALPVNPKTFEPVYPHQYLLVNTVFEVIHSAGLRTAWNDKHPSYEILNGPSGHGVDELYTPEISAPVASTGEPADKNVTTAIANDALKVDAVLQELKGFDHTGGTKVGVPTLLGLNFQAVSVGQKVVKGGYTDAQGSPSELLGTALASVDQQLGSLFKALHDEQLDQDTAIVLTAKHGQAPIDPTTIRWIDDSHLVPFLASHGIVAWTASNDTTGFLWLKDPSQASAAALALEGTPAVYPVYDPASKKNLFSNDPLAATWGKFDAVLWGDSRPYHDPSGEGRYPDLVLRAVPGSVYGKPWKKIAEHGGFSDPETHVALVVVIPNHPSATVEAPVTTTQVAPTLLKLVGLDPQALKAVQQEKTPILPGLF